MIKMKIFTPLVASLALLSATAFAESFTNNHYDQQFYASNNGNVTGNTKGAITIIDFFDYRCPTCRKAQMVLDDLIKHDKNVRVVYIDYPVLGDQSIFAAKAAVAAGEQDKYLALHSAMMSAKKPLTEEEIYRLAATQGTNVAKLKANIHSDQVAKIISDNLDMGQELNFDFVPTLIVGYTSAPHQAQNIGSNIHQVADTVKQLEKSRKIRFA